MNGLEFLGDMWERKLFFSVSVSGFVRICMDEDGNEKRVSPFLLALKDQKCMLGHFFPRVNSFFFGLSPVLLLLSCYFWGEGSGACRPRVLL